MKKIFMMLAMVQMMICSCMKPEIENTQIKDPAAGEVVFTAVIEQTKALPSAGGVVSWTENEEIGVYDGTDYVKATVLGIEGNKIKFSAKVDPTAASYVAINPYEAGIAGDGQTINFAAAQTTGKHVISIASFPSAEETPSFKNVGNLLRFKVNKTAVKKAKIVGNNAEKLAGNVTANAETGEATGTLTEAEIVTDITPGVDNFIALAPGVSLPDGFTITLYGDDECTDYQGEVASAGAIDFTGENGEKARNRMINIGVIDGWIDNYKLWEAGKPIVIAGKEYSQKSTGLPAILLSANARDYDLGDNSSEDIKLHKNSGAFFLETANGYSFIASTFTDIYSDTFLISRYDNAPVVYKPSGNFSLIAGNMYLKGIHISSPSSGSNVFTVSSNEYGDLYLDQCKVQLASGKQFYYANGTIQRGIKNLKVVNSKIENTSASRVVLINISTSFSNLKDIKTIELNNNVFYSANATGYITIMQDLYNPSDAGTIETEFSFKNNTLYNTHNTSYGGADIDVYTIGKKLTITGNIFYNEIPDGTAQKNTSNLVSSRDQNKTYDYVIEDNVSNHFAILYFRTYNGYWKPTTDQVTKATDLAFKTADTEKGIFIPIDKYASYGAKQ